MMNSDTGKRLREGKERVAKNCMDVTFEAYRLVRLDRQNIGWKVWSKTRKEWRGAQKYAHRLGGALHLMLEFSKKGTTVDIGDEVKGKAGELVKTDEQCKMPLTADEKKQVEIMAQWCDYFHELIDCGVAPLGDCGVLEYGGYTVKRNDKLNLKATGPFYKRDSGWYGSWNHAAHDLLDLIMTGPHKTLSEAQVAGAGFLQYAAKFFNFDLNRKQDGDGKPLKRPPALPTLGTLEK
jgi:hypothetical protein